MNHAPFGKHQRILLTKKKLVNPPSIKWADCLQFTAVTDVGMRRSNNQDAHSVVPAKSEEDWPQQGHILVVADGMGAHAAGELASELAVRGVTQLFHQYEELDPIEALYKAIAETNQEIHQRGKANSDFHNMGTTVSAMVMLPQGAIIGHVGDSRIYRFRNNTLEQMTFDHSLVWELQASGQIDKNSDLISRVPSNVITRSLGPHAEVKVDIEGPFVIEQGDLYLLCTDGVSGMIEDEEIAVIIANLPTYEAAQFIVDLANIRGGSDNSTVIVALAAGTQIVTSRPDETEAALEPIPVRRAHPGFWITAFLLMVMAFWISETSTWVFGLPIAVLGLGTLATGIWLGRSYRQEVANTPAFTPPQGKGPYTNTGCKVTREFLAKLLDKCRDLKKVALENQATIEWDHFNELTTQAASAAKKQGYNESMRYYARAISFMMKEFRFQKLKQLGTTVEEE
ncbi:MAG: serine/threonine-protein phosphatase [Planctomycetaceae bacterium]|nr:serine/threonine-protein phosphatase [Planctomycetaceae bacterium]